MILPKLYKSIIGKESLLSGYRGLVDKAFDTSYSAMARKAYRGTVRGLKSGFSYSRSKAYDAAFNVYSESGMVGGLTRAGRFISSTKGGFALTAGAGVAYGVGIPNYSSSQRGGFGFGTYGSSSWSSINMHSSGIVNARMSHSGLVQALHNGQ